MNNAHWVIFAVCPANQEILVIDSLYDPTSLCHVTIYQNMVQLIQDYQQSKYPPPKIDGHTITAKKQVDGVDCGVCLSLTI
jgi:hypothetical protein